MPEIAYQKNEFIPLDQAVVSVNDRGYLFADGVYEVIVTRAGQPFLMENHLQRLSNSAAAIGLKLPFKEAEITAIIRQGIKRAGFPESMIYLQVSRGVAPRQHVYPDEIEPGLLLTFRERPRYPPRMTDEGIAVMVVAEIRWQRCDIKSIALLPNIMMKKQAIERGFDEALFVDQDGLVREASAANVFLVKNNCLVTPQADRHILNGITRSYIVETARNQGLEVEERNCHLDEFIGADEVFITSSTFNLLPVIKIDNHLIAGGRPGPISQRVRTFF